MAYPLQKLRGQDLAEMNVALLSVPEAKSALETKMSVTVPITPRAEGEQSDGITKHESFSRLAVPIYDNKEIIGVLQVMVFDGSECFNSEDQSRLAGLAAVAGLALGGLRRRQGQLDAVLRAAEGITRYFTLPETLQAVVTQARIAFPTLDVVTLWYRAPDTDRVVAGPYYGVENADFEPGDPTDSKLVLNAMQRPPNQFGQ